MQITDRGIRYGLRVEFSTDTHITYRMDREDRPAKPKYLVRDLATDRCEVLPSIREAREYVAANAL